MNKLNLRRVATVGAAALATSVGAHAEIDVAPVVTAIAAIPAAIILIGNADLLVRVAIKGYTYVRSALGR